MDVSAAAIDSNLTAVATEATNASNLPNPTNSSNSSNSSNASSAKMSLQLFGQKVVPVMLGSVTNRNYWKNWRNDKNRFEI